MRWFDNITSIDELRQKYKELLIKYHPDNSPDTDTTETMQCINAEYDNLIKKMKGVTPDTDSSTDFSEDELKKVLNELVKLHKDIIIEVVGSWIWVYGNDTKQIKNQLKELNFRWSPQKQKWHWGTSKHRTTKQMDMEFIRSKYGSTIYTTYNENPKAIP